MGEEKNDNKLMMLMMLMTVTVSLSFYRLWTTRHSQELPKVSAGRKATRKVPREGREEKTTTTMTTRCTQTA
jgi:hypothetical protein